MKRIGVLFVCTGNICRSPTAQGVFEFLLHRQQLARHFQIDSAGLSGYHVGQAPDPRTQQAARQRGIDLAGQRARKVQPEDFSAFDYLIAMDDGHYEALSVMAQEVAERKATVHRLLEFAPDLQLTEVPDPYYGPLNGFHRVFDIVDAGCRGLLAELRRRHAL